MPKLTFSNLAAGVEPEVTSLEVYDDDHKPVTLGAEQQLGRKGATGRVYTIPSATDYCVKIFNAQVRADKTRYKELLARVQAMLQVPSCARDPRLCWPLGLVYDKKGEAVGFAMRRISKDYKPFKTLFFGAKNLQRLFPGWRRRDLAVVAKNFVDTVIFLQAQGIQVADFNAENFMVNAQGNVVFLDCDSYSFYGFDGVPHCSDMYSPDSAPVEILRNPKCTGQPRTEEQTRFSAAVLVFQLMELGQHPYVFAGQCRDGSYTGMPSENILKGLCPLGKGTGLQQDPMWYALWSWLTDSLQRSFIATFRDGWEVPSARTPLEQLSNELGKFAYECEREPERDLLVPHGPKPRRPMMVQAGMVPQQPMYQSAGVPSYRPQGRGAYMPHIQPNVYSKPRPQGGRPKPSFATARGYRSFNSAVGY